MKRLAAVGVVVLVMLVAALISTSVANRRHLKQLDQMTIEMRDLDAALVQIRGWKVVADAWQKRANACEVVFEAAETEAASKQWSCFQNGWKRCTISGIERPKK